MNNQPNTKEMSIINQTLLKSKQTDRPYSVMKYQQIYMAASNRLIEFFTLHNIKKYIDYENKTKFQRQLMDQILKQLREFLRKKANREFQNLLTKAQQNGIQLEEKFQSFDEIFFRNFIVEHIDKKQSLKIQSPFEVYDIEDEILNQLQNRLAKIYAQL